MATKTITIDMEAYRRLATAKAENESFSQTIKRVVPQPLSTEQLIGLFHRAGAQLSEGFFLGVESALAARGASADKERVNGLLGHHRSAGPRRPRGQTKASRRRSKAKGP